MRALTAALTAALFALVGAPPALAQSDPYAEGLLRRPSMAPVETSPLQRMKRPARDWIAAERARQAAAPTSLLELAIAIEAAIGPDLDKVARRERIGDGDLFLVVMYDIVAGARDQAVVRLEKLRAEGASDIEIQTAATARARLDANLAEVVQDQTIVSRSLIPDLAWRQ